LDHIVSVPLVQIPEVLGDVLIRLASKTHVAVLPISRVLECVWPVHVGKRVGQPIANLSLTPAVSCGKITELFDQCLAMLVVPESHGRSTPYQNLATRLRTLTKVVEVTWNGYVEPVNSRMRDELLDGELFLHIDETKYVVECWRMDYNHYQSKRNHNAYH